MGVQNDTNQFDLFGRFQDEKLQSEYVIYCLEQKWKYSFAIIVTLILTLAVIETVVGTWFNEELTVEGVEIRDVEIYGIVSLCLIAIAGASGAALVWNTFDDTNQSGRNLSSFYQIIFMLSFNLLFILKTIKQIHLQIPDCIPRQYSFTKTFHDHEFNSSSSSEFHQLALLSADSNIPPVCSSHSLLALTSRPMVLMLSFTPHILMGIIYEPRLYLVLACQIPSAVLISYSIYDSLFSFPPILLSFIILIVHLVGLHFQRAQSFLNQRKVQQLLEENEKNADANLAMEMKHMISNIAHDLKTPLASFSSGIDVIREILLSVKHQLNATRTAETEKPIDIVADCFNSMEVCLKNIHNTNAFMLMTINRCIDYTKASKGMKLVPKYETVDLGEALQFPIECMSNIQERIGIKVEALSEEICSHIITDKQWLQENLLCLLSNAVKYSTEGSVTITARLTANSDKVVNPAAAKYATQSSSRKTYPEITSSTYRSNEEFIIFEVEDTGIGLSEEAMKNLFNPFKQAQRLAGGTGLGLYSLAKRMEALKGQYGVRKREDGKQGSLFWFSIPYKPDKIEANEKSFVLEQTSLRLFSTGTPGKTIKVKTSFRVLDVLVVDDAPSILKMSSMMLKRQGHEIWTAENGEIALKRMEEKWRVNGKGFDLVLMDLQMPVMDGLEATRRLRGMEAEGREWMNPGFHHLVIGLSANTDNETSEEAFKSGMNDLFEKPFSFTAMNKIFDRFFQ